MKITAIETLVCHARMRNWIFVEVVTDQPGLHGWGEATLEWHTRSVVGAIEDITQLLIGEDPRRIEHLWQMMYRQHLCCKTGARDCAWSRLLARCRRRCNASGGSQSASRPGIRQGRTGKGVRNQIQTFPWKRFLTFSSPDTFSSPSRRKTCWPPSSPRWASTWTLCSATDPTAPSRTCPTQNRSLS